MHANWGLTEPHGHALETIAVDLREYCRFSNPIFAKKNLDPPNITQQ